MSVCREAATRPEITNINVPIVSANTPKAVSAEAKPPEEMAKTINPARIGPVQPIPAAL